MQSRPRPGLLLVKQPDDPPGGIDGRLIVPLHRPPGRVGIFNRASQPKRQAPFRQGDGAQITNDPFDEIRIKAVDLVHQGQDHFHRLRVAVRAPDVRFQRVAETPVRIPVGAERFEDRLLRDVFKKVFLPLPVQKPRVVVDERFRPPENAASIHPSEPPLESFTFHIF